MCFFAVFKMVEYFIRILFKVAGLVATGFVSQFQHAGQAFDDEDSGFYGTFFTYFLFVLFFFAVDGGFIVSYGLVDFLFFLVKCPIKVLSDGEDFVGGFETHYGDVCASVVGVKDGCVDKSAFFVFDCIAPETV